ncbi:glycosyl hydrolase, BNR repeat-containing protein, partial [mine drainage metagenome]
GTETGFYLSFDNGRHWQPLQLNLPTVSVRDIAIHGRALVIATHGRGFWMLDDLAPIREVQADWLHQALVLEHPAPAYRLRRTLYRDEPLPPETPHAANPTTGAAIYYYLGTRPKGPLTLTIRTPSGQLVRRYTSTQTFPPPPSRPVPDTLDREATGTHHTPGLNRFVW